MSELQNYNLPIYQSRVFSGVPGWELLKNYGENVYFTENHIIVETGDTIRYCYLILSGRVLAYETTEDGTEHIFNIFTEGSIFLETNVMCHYPADVRMRTDTPVECVRITAENLWRAMTEREQLRQLVFESMAGKFYSAMDRLKEQYNTNATYKVYNLLMILAANMGKPLYGDWIMIDMKLNQQLISSMLGLNRITVNKALKEIRDQNCLMMIDNAYYCVRESPELSK